MRNSCITHPAHDSLIIVRKWQIEFCEGNKCASALLSFFEYWHNIKLEQSYKAICQNDIAERHGDDATQDTSLLQFHTIKELEDGILIYSKDAINIAIKLLEEKGVISIHKNPNERYKFDNTRYFLFIPKVINNWLQNYNNYRLAENQHIVVGKPTMVICKTDDGDMQNLRTITETTNKITTENNKPPIPPKIHDSKKEDINTVLTELLNNNNFTEQENEKIQEWLQHKKEQKKAYKPQGLKSLIAEIRNQKEKGCNICEAIQLSISNQWQGILYEKGYTKQLYQKPADKHQAIRDALHNCNDQDFTGDAEEIWMRRGKRNMSS